MTELSKPRNRLFLLVAAIVTALGTLLRYRGIEFGLPFLYEADEYLWISIAFRIFETGDWNPHWFHNPGTPTIYLFAAVIHIYAMLGNHTDSTESLAEFSAAFWSEPGDIFFWVRIACLVFAAFSILLTYLIAKRIAGPWTGLFAATLLASNPLHAEYSRIARIDIHMTFLMLLTTWFILSIAKTGRLRDYVLAGVFLGVATATKYPALILALCVCVAHILNQLDRQLPIRTNFSFLVVAGAATIAGFFIGSPFAAIEWELLIRNLVLAARPTHLSATSEGFWPTLGWYLSDPLYRNFHIMGCALVMAGSFFVIRNRSHSGIIILAFPVLFMLFISALTLRWARWAIPALPFMTILAAIGLTELTRMLRQFSDTRAVSGLAAVIAMVAIAIPLQTAVTQSRAWAGSDTRTVAREWLLQNVPEGSGILLEGYTPQLPRERFKLFVVANHDVVTLPPTPLWESASAPLRYSMPGGVIGTMRFAGAFRKQPVDFIVMANHYQRRLREAERFPDNRQYDREIRVYERIMADNELVFAADPKWGELPGPPIRIYRVPKK